ncbi:rhotekin-2 [Gracilinanus agilis]|uniref:rhotekin-2 n=1 Tax=Gracilinanus agilis TaxID=191870 RepID=UPI001CFEAA1E|nr:rhotekin-2 [Gracilinanus agilis]
MEGLAVTLERLRGRVGARARFRSLSRSRSRSASASGSRSGSEAGARAVEPPLRAGQWLEGLAEDLAQQPDGSIEGKLDFEMRMREGIRKLLSLSTQKDQILEVVKNLMVCNARIMAYTEELQKLEAEAPVVHEETERRCRNEAEARTACKGKVALSDIRIPLMWKDSDHFSNKEGSQRYAVFCLFKMGAEIFDTDMVIVDKTITDLCFENVTIFNDAGPDFQVKLEVYSCCAEEPSLASTSRVFAKKLRSSFRKARAKKLSCMQQENDLDDDFHINSQKLSVEYNLLAHTTLTLEHTEDSFKTHPLTITGNEESSFWLPLYGNMCCRLAAQPACMTEDAFKGYLNQQQIVQDVILFRRFYCVLRGSQLLCYCCAEEIEAKLEPTLVVPINKDTRVFVVPKKADHFSIVNIEAGLGVTEVFLADDSEAFHAWMGAFSQHFLDFSQWKHCCEELMKIEIMSPRKPPLFLTKEATSVYHDMSIDSPMKMENLTEVKKKNEDTKGKFFIGLERPLSPWAAIFDGTRQMVIHKNVVVLPANEQLNSNDEKVKKRRAPSTPSEKPLCSVKGQTKAGQLDKENVWEETSFVSRTSLLSTSSLMHQL